MQLRNKTLPLCSLMNETPTGQDTSELRRTVLAGRIVSVIDREAGDALPLSAGRRAMAEAQAKWIHPSSLIFLSPSLSLFLLLSVLSHSPPPRPSLSLSFLPTFSPSFSVTDDPAIHSKLLCHGWLLSPFTDFSTLPVSTGLH